MTREEAIEVIKLAMAQVEWDYPMDYAAAFDMAIKALEQEQTTKIEESNFSQEQYKADLQSAYDCGLKRLLSQDDYCLVSVASVKRALEQETRWILVSERLPENKETVLVTFKHFVSGNTIGLGSVILLRGKPHWHVREQNLGTYDVLAWMPLPKAYSEVEE